MLALAASAPLILSLASAVTATTAIVLTIYQQFWRAPKLTLALALDPAHGDLVTLQPVMAPGSDTRERDTTEHWVRLRVHNARRKRSAQEVEVLYIGSERNGRMSIDPRPLRYTGTSENTHHVDILARGSEKPNLKATVPPGVFRHIDFLAALPSETVMRRLRGRPRLAVWPGPGIELDEGAHTIYLAVTATDTDAVFYRLAVEISNGWSDDPSVWWGERVVLSGLERLSEDEVDFVRTPPS